MCCGNRSDPAKERLLTQLVDAGIELPEGAQVWNARQNGWRWRIIDRHGREPRTPIGSSCHPSHLDGPLRIVERDGALHVHGSEPCGWETR